MELEYQPEWLLLSNIPDDFPICYIGGSGNYSLLATRFSEVNPESILQCNVRTPDCRIDKIQSLPFLGGYVGIIPYRDHNLDKKSFLSHIKIYQIHQSLIFDHLNRKLFLCSSQKRGQWEIDYKSLFQTIENTREKTFSAFFSLIPENTEQQYLDNANSAIQQIKQGRFYQINLLRYFKISEKISRFDYISRMEKFSGPYGCIFDFEQYKLISFSPEQFVKINQISDELKVFTYPIKGTIARSHEKIIDEANKKFLTTSKKDLAELHIIVDLMRNDLNRICQSQSVKVLKTHEIKSFKNVHHLVASLEGHLKKDMTWEEFFARTSPGGSITGAPKKEVMQAIYEFEKRERGYFMGHAFLWDPDSNYFDSSILIRTMVGNTESEFSYAAGSGIVVNSNPESELREIYDKCKVITEPY